MSEKVPHPRPVSYGMAKLIHVIPITRGGAKTELSYFTIRDVSVGSVISVPLRKKKVSAMVISLENVADAKARIRRERFAVKKVVSAKAVPLFLPSLVEAAEKTADYFATSTGAVLFAVTSKAILEDPKDKAPQEISSSKTDNNVQNQKLVFTANAAERLEEYRSIVRESFAKGKSLYLLTPTIQGAERLEQALKRGIEKYAVVLHSALSKKEIRIRWKDALEEPHPMLIIGTGSFLSIPRSDIETVIVENENSSYYRSKNRPYLDIRVFAERLSEAMHARLIFADLPLSVESAHRSRIGALDELNPLKTRFPSAVESRIIDMREKEKEKTKKTFTTLSNELKELVEESIEHGGGAFIYTARRGLSPMTVCLDCGSPVVCEIRNTPLILYKGSKENVFVCHEHGTSRSAKERCRNCDSWKLQSYGVGIELVSDEIRKAFPEIPVHIIESKTTPSHKEAKKVAEKFYEEGGILIGTEMALPYVESVEVSAVASIDSLLSLPEWNAYEKVFSILTRLRVATKKTLLIQTRKPEVELLSLAAEGNLIDFYRAELNERENFRYPPFFTLISIATSGPREKVVKEMDTISRELSDYEFLKQDTLVKKTATTYTLQGFLRIKRGAWPDEKLLAFLRKLPLSVSVRVDPESIL